MGDELRGENLVHLNVRFSTETELKKIQDFLYEKSGQGVSFTGLVEAMVNEVTIVTAVHNIKSNKGSKTAGVDKIKMDKYLQMPKDELILLIQSSFRNYRPKPARREYIEKSNGKKRPLGIPTVLDRIIQECVRIIIEPICEARFYPQSYGFRPYRAQKHAIRGIINVINAGCKSPDQPVWAIEGDIKGCFDNIDHPTLIGVLNRKIKDSRFLNLIRMFLKAGYMEEWNFHETYSGCPQGGIISPILANIYLNELDRYITQLKKEFDHGYNPRNFTEEYNTIRHKRDALHEKIKKAEGTMREQLIAQHKQLTKQLFRTPAKACTDKRLKYVRYADDFLIAINGTREECEEIKAKLTDFVRDTLKMELSQEKTLITHSNTPARFLGFDVRVRRDSSVKRSGKRKMRTMNNKVELNIPLKDKVETYLLSHSIAKRDGKRLIPIHRPILLNRTDLEIVMISCRTRCRYCACSCP